MPDDAAKRRAIRRGRQLLQQLDRTIAAAEKLKAIRVAFSLANDRADKAKMQNGEANGAA
jgi:hypothetical protein